MSSSISRHRVVIVGSGFGGLAAAKALRRARAVAWFSLGYPPRPREHERAARATGLRPNTQRPQMTGFEDSPS